VSGARIPVAAIKRLHEDGLDVDAIIDEYPGVTRDDVEAALKHEVGSVA